MSTNSFWKMASFPRNGLNVTCGLNMYFSFAVWSAKLGPPFGGTLIAVRVLRGAVLWTLSVRSVAELMTPKPP